MELRSPPAGGTGRGIRRCPENRPAISTMTSNCPACGAPVTLRFSSSVQTVCEYCRSILVRHDLDLNKVGEVADVREDASPILIGTEGVYRGKPFQVAGRI